MNFVLAVEVAHGTVVGRHIGQLDLAVVNLSFHRECGDVDVCRGSMFTTFVQFVTFFSC